VSKWATPIVPEAAGAIMRKALRVAMAERPGPVHITTAANVLATEATDADIRLPPLGIAGEAPTVFSTANVTTNPASILNRSRRPILLAGMSAVRAGC